MQNKTDIKDILKILNIVAEVIEVFKEKDRFTEYLLDTKYILRISKSELPEQMKNYRVNSLSLISKIHSFGQFTVYGHEYYYLLFDYIQGNELWSVAQNLTDNEQRCLGKQIAQFLKELHLITDNYYDIGHYIPTIPRYAKTWQEGHLEYTMILKSTLSKKDLKLNSQKTILKAFDYIYANINALKYQTGAKLLHNDFHPKNIIVHEGRLAGITDWECSQFGEEDFELSRLFDWCIYPDSYLFQENNLKILLESIIKNLHITSAIPHIEKRITIYQLEHELNQLIWHGKKQEEERVKRINEWLGDKVSTFLKI